MQLVAYGAQDIYLTGNPMITYFKVVYRRHTNFAMESIQQTFNGSIGFGKRVTALISRNGDLVSGMHLELTLPATAGGGWINNVGHQVIQQVEVEIGGQLIDRHYADWLEIWAQLTVPASKKLGYLQMIGQDMLGADAAATGLQNGVQGARSRSLFVPLQFWFCRNVGLALPLIALQYHEVKVNIQFGSNNFNARGGLNAAATTGLPAGAGDLEAALWVDYIYLDTDERRRFAQVSHEYLIEQLQFTGSEAYAAVNRNATAPKTINLNFNHPVKELIWVCQENAGAQYFLGSYVSGTAVATGKDNFAGAATFGINPVLDAKLMLNGHDRFATRDGPYFSKVQPYQFHTCVPDSPGINVYSFALKPEEHQPSGTCNFSRIDNAKLQLTLTGGTTADTPLAGGVIKVFATNYNVLRVMSGMGGLAYSN
jgi:hypothetical protein